MFMAVLLQSFLVLKDQDTLDENLVYYLKK